jgi:heme/copper-type cytochrome/quinol oxidase subunit 2
MRRIAAIFMAFYITLASTFDNVRRRRVDERGSVTIEHVLWSVAVIAIVAIVVAAVKAYVTAQAGKIN